MTIESQSQKFWGTGPKRGAENPIADPIERGRERGVVVTREESGIYVEHTPPVAPPPQPDTSARGLLAEPVERAAAIVAEAETRRAAAADKLAQTQRLLVSATAADRWIEQLLEADTGALSVEDARLAAAKAHRDELAARIKTWEANGDLDAYDAKNREQWDLDRVIASFEKRSFKAGAEVGSIGKDAPVAMGQLLAARREASRLAAKLGFARHRDSGLDVASAARRIAKAFVAGFCSAGHRADALREWIGGR